MGVHRLTVGHGPGRHADELALAGNDITVVRAFRNPLDRWVILPLLRLLPRRRRQAVMERSSLRHVVRPLTPGAGLPGLPDWEAVPCPGVPLVARHTTSSSPVQAERSGVR